MVTIIFAHPWHGSFNKAILNTVTDLFDEQNKPYQVIDLHKEKFNPAFSEEELAVYNRGRYLDEHVGRYQHMLQISDEVIFIFPIWWSGLPAILKGFIDKTFLKDFAYSTENGWTPLLKVNKTTLLTTSERETTSLIKDCGDPIISNFINATLYSVGINNATWLNCDFITSQTDEYREEYLRKVAKQII